MAINFVDGKYFHIESFSFFRVDRKDTLFRKTYTQNT